MVQTVSKQVNFCDQSNTKKKRKSKYPWLKWAYGLSGWARLCFSSSVTMDSTFEVDGHLLNRICLFRKISSLSVLSELSLTPAVARVTVGFISNSLIYFFKKEAYLYSNHLFEEWLSIDAFCWTDPWPLTKHLNGDQHDLPLFTSLFVILCYLPIKNWISIPKQIVWLTMIFLLKQIILVAKDLDRKVHPNALSLVSLEGPDFFSFIYCKINSNENSAH